MNKKLILLLILILAIAIFPLRARWQLESDHDNVEIIMDGREFQEIKFADSALTWNSLSRTGVTGASLPTFTLEDLVEKGKIAKWTPAELAGSQSGIIDNISEDKLDLNSQGVIFYFPEESNSTLNPEIMQAWSDLYNTEVVTRQGETIIHFPNWHEELEDLIPGYDESLLDNITAAGLRPVARLRNQPDFKLNKLLIEKMAALDMETVIFAGDEVAGFPGHLAETAEVMEDNNIIYGFIEPFLADQDGAGQLASNYSQNVMRVHSMQREEMEQNSMAEVSNRYLRAVQERNVRYLYLRGISAAENFSGRGEQQLQLAELLASDLQAEGFSLQTGSPLQGQPSSDRIILLAAFLLVLAGLLCLSYLATVFPPKLYSIFIGLWLVLAAGLSGLYFILDIVLYRQLLALLAAVIFPVISGFNLTDVMLDKGKTLPGLFNAVFATLGGGLLVAVILGTDLFFNQINVFRGVKIAFILPLIVVAAYYLLSEVITENTNKNELKNLFKKLWQQPFLWRHLAILLMAGVFLLIYIGRTGNLPLIPVPAWEVAIRSRLEGLLSVRPRFKEFFIGHPFLFLLPFIKVVLPYRIFKLTAVLLAVIGQITVINSFSHLHTPLSVTLTRVFHGYWLAIPVALIFAAVIWSARRLVYRGYYIFIGQDET